jgi:hypothetical protein
MLKNLRFIPHRHMTIPSEAKTHVILSIFGTDKAVPFQNINCP